MVKISSRGFGCSGALPRFAEAPEYRNGEGCLAAAAGVCDPGLVHIAMTLDAHYLRGSMAAVYSLLKHASCPESIFFHFLAVEAADGEEDPEPELLRRAVAASFPSLRIEIYPFRAEAVAGLISASVHAALEAPLNYTQNHLADQLPRCVPWAIYLDSDVLAADDVRRLWRRPSTATPTSPATSHRRSGEALPEWNQSKSWKELKFGYGGGGRSARDSRYWDRDDRHRDEDYTEDEDYTRDRESLRARPDTRASVMNTKFGNIPSGFEELLERLNIFH